MEKSKGTDLFKETIQNYLNDRAEKEPLFAKILSKENKNIDDCVNYIISTVQKSGMNGFEDSEIFNMAVHYYDEDDIKDIKQVSASVVINRTVDEPTKQNKEKKEKPTKTENGFQFSQGSLF